MYRIQQISDYPLQKKVLNLPDGTQVTLTLYYTPQQQGWFIRELQHQDFVLRGFRITNGANIFRQYKNIIPFGLACVSKDGREPFMQTDFADGHSELYLLSEEEVQQYEEYLSGSK